MRNVLLYGFFIIVITVSGSLSYESILAQSFFVEVEGEGGRRALRRRARR